MAVTIVIAANDKTARDLPRMAGSLIRLVLAHDLFGKPLRTFPDHALMAHTLGITRRCQSQWLRGVCHRQAIPQRCRAIADIDFDLN
jgi:hypothetical protein